MYIPETENVRQGSASKMSENYFKILFLFICLHIFLQKNFLILLIDLIINVVIYYFILISSFLFWFCLCVKGFTCNFNEQKQAGNGMYKQ